MMTTYFMAIDQGTTSSRCIILNTDGLVIAKHQLPHQQYYPKNGWVEHDPEQIWQNTLQCCQQALLKAKLTAEQIASLGISNQRETTVIWDKATGAAIYPAIVWQDRRTEEFCQEMRKQNLQSYIIQKTGLCLDPYFSASKIVWILKNVPKAMEKAQQGQLCFGTMDSFLIWRFTAGRVHATDVTNAARTHLFNIQTLQWDKDLCQCFAVPMNILPKVKNCSDDFGETDKKWLGSGIKITAVMGDQQAAAFGQSCINKADIKCTFGTGSFMLLNTGDTIHYSKHQLLSTVLFKIGNKTAYALEGSSFIAGSGIKWLRDQLKLFTDVNDTAAIAESLSDNEGVYCVPAFTGLGAPFWQANARASFHGLTLDSKAAHFVRAMLEAIVYQCKALLQAMEQDTHFTIKNLLVDGGLTNNTFLMQWLANILGIKVHKRAMTEITAYGVGLLSGFQSGYYQQLSELQNLPKKIEIYSADMAPEKAMRYYDTWQSLIREK